MSALDQYIDIFSHKSSNDFAAEINSIHNAPVFDNTKASALITALDNKDNFNEFTSQWSNTTLNNLKRILIRYI